VQGKAKDMVALAERIRARLAGPGGGAEEGEGSRQDMQDLLLSVGIASPVTRENAGALYHQQLSRQVSDGPRILWKSSADNHGSVKAALSSADRRVYSARFGRASRRISEECAGAVPSAPLQKGERREWLMTGGVSLSVLLS
jgi:hypothetical protein